VRSSLGQEPLDGVRDGPPVAAEVERAEELERGDDVRVPRAEPFLQLSQGIR
jgi:hypothetical protein